VVNTPPVLILCGGRGERLGPLSAHTPKGLVEIGGRPILWHIMQQYSSYGFVQFILALGHLGWMIKEYFQDDTNYPEGWQIFPVRTGWHTSNGERIRRLAPLLKHRTFLMAWCDGVSNINHTAVLDFHRSHGKLCTLVAVHPPTQFGRLTIVDQQVAQYAEKKTGSDWVSGGVFACEPGVLPYVQMGDVWEQRPMQQLVADGQVMAYEHTDFWHCMDTVKDQQSLNRLWESGEPPWQQGAETR
jgi:glucose-1-phosphate cytidylyltransferase